MKSLYCSGLIWFLDVDPDDDSNPGSITMSIEVNGVQYEGILFAKLPDEGYVEPPKVTAEAPTSPAKDDKADESLEVDEPKTTDGTVVVEPTEPVENQN